MNNAHAEFHLHRVSGAQDNQITYRHIFSWNYSIDIFMNFCCCHICFFFLSWVPSCMYTNDVVPEENYMSWIVFPQPKSFLFMEKLKGKQDESSTSNKSSKKAVKAQISAGRRRILEEERLRVVEAYRSMKASKYTLTNQPVTWCHYRSYVVEFDSYCLQKGC